MLLIRELRLAPGERETKLPALAARALGLPPGALKDLRIVRRSLDARRKSDIHWSYAVAASLPNEEAFLSRGLKNVETWEPFRYEIPQARSGHRPVVAGFGPGGMFAGLLLAEAGLRPIVLERGGPVRRRRAAVERYWNGGPLDPECNVQFGEGGAGTFSDGKLATNTHDPRIAWVLEKFRDFGAPEHITYDAKPHVGTDVLGTVVENLRRRVEELGGEVRFDSRFSDYKLDQGGALEEIAVLGPEGEYLLPCRDLILAPGHSARDTFELLYRKGLPMEAKPFAMGVRIEHRQSFIDAAQYGASRAQRKLPPADYKLNLRLPEGEVYTFCMCPGGYVVAAASEGGGVVTNGMSYSGRAGENANAALLVGLRPEDFPGSGPLAGMEWQREIERACFAYGGGNALAPAQTLGDFLAERKSGGPGSVLPSYRPGVVWGDLREVLPEKLTAALAAALPELGRKLRGFDAPDAVLTAPESRSSSPVRILRDRDSLEAVPGLYPCGEGAGYAGGITSAAVDGLRCGERIIEKYRLTGEAKP